MRGSGWGSSTAPREGLSRAGPSPSIPTPHTAELGEEQTKPADVSFRAARIPSQLCTSRRTRTPRKQRSCQTSGVCSPEDPSAEGRGFSPAPQPGNHSVPAPLPQLYWSRPLQTPHWDEGVQEQEASLPCLQLDWGMFKFMGNVPFPLIPKCRKLICSLTQALTAALQLLRPLPPILMNLFNCYARRNLIKLLYITPGRSSTLLSLRGRGPEPTTGVVFQEHFPGN